MTISNLKALIAIYEGKYRYEVALERALLEHTGTPVLNGIIGGEKVLLQKGLVEAWGDVRPGFENYSLTRVGGDLVHSLLDNDQDS